MKSPRVFEKLTLLAAVCAWILLWPGTLSAQAPHQLQLSARVLEQSYCSVNGNPDGISLQLKLGLRYTNVGSQRIIVYRGHDLFFQTKIRADGAPAGQGYEVHLLNMHYFDEEFERIEARSPSKVFVTLAPNQSFERELIVGIGVTHHSKQRTSNSVYPGNHVLRLIVSTWYQSPKLAEQLRHQWQRKGYLWSQPLTSGPLQLVVEKPVATSPCR